jgi:hypothetical protein
MQCYNDEKENDGLLKLTWKDFLYVEHKNFVLLLLLSCRMEKPKTCLGFMVMHSSKILFCLLVEIYIIQYT